MSCPFHRWLWTPYPLLPDTFVVQCEDCGRRSFLVTVLYRGAGIQFAYQPYGG